MVAALYVEINAICIIILGIILFKMWFMGSILGKRTLFVYTLVNAIVLFALDLVWGLLDGTNYAFSHELNLLVNAVYLFQAGHLGYSWYLFNNSVLNCSNRKQLTRHIIATLPLLVLFVSSFSSIWTGWMFSVDEYNVYHREWLYPLQVLVSYAYLIYSAVKAFIYGLKEKTYVKKTEELTLASFIILPFICGTFQVAFMGIPLLNAGISLSFLFVFISLQEHQISMDPLTELNNRHQLTRHLTLRISSQSRKNKLLLLMIDIDFSKRLMIHMVMSRVMMH